MTTSLLLDKLERTPLASVEPTPAITVRTKAKFFVIINKYFSVYVEFGATSTDSITLTNTYVSGGLTTAKTFNILARQISCTATYK